MCPVFIIENVYLLMSACGKTWELLLACQHLPSFFISNVWGLATLTKHTETRVCCTSFGKLTLIIQRNYVIIALE